MEQSLSSIAFKGSVTEAIFEAKSKKKLFVVYLSGDNPESGELEKSTWTDLSLAELLSKYCILLQISEGSADADNLSAIYPQKSSPCITVIAYNGLQLWQNEGFVSAEILTSSLEKAWLNLHLQTAASVLTAALATQKTELLVPRNSNLPGQGNSSTSDAPSPLTDNRIPYQDTRTPTNFETVDKKEHLPVKKVDIEVVDNISPAPENEPGCTHAEHASSSKVNELLDTVKLEPANIVNDEVGHPSVQETNLVDLGSEGKMVTSEVVVSESKSAGQGKSSDDHKIDDRDLSLEKSDVHLNIRLPDCTSLQDRFSLTTTLREVKDYVDKKQEISMRSYDIAIPYPRKVFGNEDMAVSPSPFLEEEEEGAQFAAETRVAPSTTLVVPERQAVITMTDAVQKGAGRKRGATTTLDAALSKQLRATVLASGPSKDSFIAALNKTIQTSVSDKHVQEWTSGTAEENNHALSLSLIETLARHSVLHKQQTTLSQSNSKLSKDVRVLKSQLAEKDKDIEKAVADCKKKYELELNKVRDELKDANKTILQKTEAFSTERGELVKANDDLRAKVNELESEKTRIPQLMRDAKNLGSRNFMKTFMSKIPNFDWGPLGQATVDFAERLRKEMAEEATKKAQDRAEQGNQGGDGAS